MSNTTKSLDYKSPDNVSVASNRTQSSAAPVVRPAIIYTPRWPHKTFMKNVPAKLSKNDNKSIVERFAARQTSDWDSAGSVISNDARQTGSESSSWSTIDSRSIESQPNLISSSADPRSDDGSFNVRFRPINTGTKYQRSTDSSQSSSNYTSDTSVNDTKTFYSQARTPVTAFDERTKYREFENTFNWSANVENRSPWVGQRTKEIFDHVGGSFETRGREVLPGKDSAETSEDSKPETAREDNSETDDDDDDDDDDGVTYEMASALCDSLAVEPGEAVTSENQCSSDDLKWTRLYRRLVNYGQLSRPQ